MVLKQNYPWFIATGVCIVGAVLIFAGRSFLLAWLGESRAYPWVLLLGWLLVAGAGASLTKAFTTEHEGTRMRDEVMVDLPAAQLRDVVARVIDDAGPFAGEARLVADEIIRLRDAGQLSKTIAGNIGSLIYQRQMHSWHSGDFFLTASIEQLGPELDQEAQQHLPDAQIDPVHVHARIADIAAGIPC